MAEGGRQGPIIIETGVIIHSTGDEASLRASDTLVHELLALGFDVSKSSRIDSRPTPTVLVTVITRPEGAQGKAKVEQQHGK
jgi:hypothetical protein